MPETTFSPTANGLRQQKAKLIEDARAIHKRIETEKRSLNAEERQQIDRILGYYDDKGVRVEGESEKFDRQIAELEKDQQRFNQLNALGEAMQKPVSESEALRQIMAGQQNGIITPAGDGADLAGLSLRGKRSKREEKERISTLREQAFRAWSMFGRAEIRQEWLDAAATLKSPLHSPSFIFSIPNEKKRKKAYDAEALNNIRIAGEQRAGTGPTQSAALFQYGAALVPEELMRQVEIALKAYWDLGSVTHMPTDGVGPLVFPQNNDTTNKGQIVTDGAQSTPVPLTFSALTLQAYLYTSNIVLLPISMMTDTAVPMEGLIGKLLGIRIGRILADHMTFGTGNSQPYGIKTQAPLGYTAASSTAIGADDLYNLKHSVDPAYRSAPSVKWMFHDKILLQIKLLKTGIGTYLWQNGLASGAPDTIDGQPYVINQSMPSTISSGVSTVVYGDLMKYITREVATQYKLVRLVERYMDQGCVGFIMFSMWDGGLNDAGTHPVTKLTH